MAHSRRQVKWIKVLIELERLQEAIVITFRVPQCDVTVKIVYTKSVPCEFHRSPRVTIGRETTTWPRTICGQRQQVTHHRMCQCPHIQVFALVFFECNSHQCSQDIIMYYASQKTKFPDEARTILVQAHGEPTIRGMFRVVIRQVSIQITVKDIQDIFSENIQG